MATFLQAVNSVLRRLREREVSSVNDNTYARLIGQLVNDSKREVEDAFNWSHLKNTIRVETVEDSFRYVLTGSTRRFRLIQDDMGRNSVFNDTNDVFLRKSPSTRWMSKHLNTNNPQKGRPEWFDFNGYDNGDVIVDLWPVPDGVYSLNFDVAIPQEEFRLDGTDDNTSIAVPDQPVILCAWSKAIYERGEDAGYLSDLAYRDYQNALADAISWDLQNGSDKIDWAVV